MENLLFLGVPKLKHNRVSIHVHVCCENSNTGLLILITVTAIKMEQFLFRISVMHPKDVDGTANSVDPD